MDSFTPRPFQFRGDGHCYQLSTNLIKLSGIAQKEASFRSFNVQWLLHGPPVLTLETPNSDDTVLVFPMILRGKRDYFSRTLSDYSFFNCFLDSVLTVRKEISSKILCLSFRAS